MGENNVNKPGSIQFFCLFCLVLTSLLISDREIEIAVIKQKLYEPDSAAIAAADDSKYLNNNELFRLLVPWVDTISDTPHTNLLNSFKSDSQPGERAVIWNSQAVHTSI